MPHPLRGLDEDVRPVAERFRAVFSTPHEQDVVTVLLGLMECDGRRTLSGIVRTVGEPPSLRGVSRCFSEAPWVQDALVASWREHVRAEMQPLVETEREQQRNRPPRRRGRPTHPSVTGEATGDDSTMSTPSGRTMEGVGTHHSTTSDQRIGGHRLGLGSRLWLRNAPVTPRCARPKRCHSSATSTGASVQSQLKAESKFPACSYDPEAMEVPVSGFFSRGILRRISPRATRGPGSNPAQRRAPHRVVRRGDRGAS